MAADDLQELDLLNPGKFWATAEHQKDVSFHIQFPNDNNTKDKIKDGEVNPGDDMIQPITVPYTACDANGVANFDFEGSGRAADMLQKLTEYYSKGGETIEQVRALIVATAREGNKIPEKAVVEVMDMILVACPIIMLKPTRDYVTVQNFKGGVVTFEAEVKFKGPITEAEFSCAPDAEMSITAGGPVTKGKGKLVVPVEEGHSYKISLPVPFVKRGESQQRAVPRRYLIVYPWGWRHGETDNQEFTREVWDGGKTTLTVAGTKNNAKVKQSIVLTAEAWASDWLAGPPPPPFYHNNC